MFRREKKKKKAKPSEGVYFAIFFSKKEEEKKKNRCIYWKMKNVYQFFIIKKLVDLQILCFTIKNAFINMSKSEDEFRLETG